ncbi:phosphoserine phosphatase [Lonepinella koalarum]|uniref:Phosphoserine phosphatase n=1 Tax=Lonepinella koalarum TaxID=53417 RepID=A0A4R1KZB4_9PAST|nr:phosphoserine phosphatase [Lonepinella koalarum]MDH2927814.1 phosphoserine phosphatase [Lonepinella koalarum]TCK70007.1 phosphoserine phosphatase [Lonepinella koalarum]TFJ90391.1 phosphoserine phosphatase [Lonepinella koalarum]
MQTILQKFPHFPTALLSEQKVVEKNGYSILFSSQLNLEKLMLFQQKCGENFQVLDGWEIANNIVLLIQGEFNPEFIAYAHELQVDAAVINFHAKLSQAGLLVMDMDSTAIKIECIDEIAKLAGTGEEVSAITAAAMRGELDFEQSLRRRVGTLKGAKESILGDVRRNLPLMEGLTQTVSELQKYGWKIAIASGGFTYFADYLKDMLGLDYAVSNQFDIVDGILTGKVKGDIVHAQYKAKVLQQLAEQFNIDPKNTVAIGDGANDLAMMSVANLGAAFHAKPKVQQQAQVVVNFADLTGLLCLLSASDRINNLTK